MTLVKFLRVERIVEDSSGNAGAAMATYTATAGIGCTIFSPDYTPNGKLVQIRLYSAQVEKVPGTRQDTNERRSGRPRHRSMPAICGIRSSARGWRPQRTRSGSRWAAAYLLR